MPKVTEEHSQARRQQIVDAAYRCFSLKGLHQTTMRDIYEEAALSPGAVYNYFEGKHEIIAASFDFDYERSHQLFEAARDSDDPLAALSELISFLFAGLKGAVELGAARVNVQGWGEAVVNPTLLATIRRILVIYRESTADIIRKAQAQGRLAPTLDPHAFANTLVSLYYGLELQLALDPQTDVDRYSEAVRALLQPAIRELPASMPGAATGERGTESGRGHDGSPGNHQGTGTDSR